MNFVYNNKCNFVAFGTNKKVEGMQNKPEAINELTNKLRDILSQRAEREVPQNGKFSPVSVSFTVPDTQNKAKVAIEPDFINPKNSRRLSVASYRIGSDRLISSYIFKGTKQEIIDYLHNSESQDRIIKIIKHLSDSVDEYYRENF